MEEVFLRVAAQHVHEDDEMRSVPNAPAVPPPAAAADGAWGGGGGDGAAVVAAAAGGGEGACAAFSRHFAALFQKRARYGARDRKAQCCAALGPLFARKSGGRRGGGGSTPRCGASTRGHAQVLSFRCCRPPASSSCPASAPAPSTTFPPGNTVAPILLLWFGLWLMYGLFREASTRDAPEAGRRPPCTRVCMFSCLLGKP